MPAHASPSEQKPAFLSVIAASVFNRSRVDRAPLDVELATLKKKEVRRCKVCSPACRGARSGTRERMLLLTHKKRGMTQ
jgi:hypothetical protein